MYLLFRFLGATTFMILGHIADFLGVDFDRVVSGGPGLAFASYPFAIAKKCGPYVRLASFLSVLLFSMLQCLGIGSVAIQTDSITANIYKWISGRFPNIGLLFLQFIVCAILFILGIPYLTPVSFKVHIF